MDEHTRRLDWDLDRRVAHSEELARKRKAWDEQQAQRRDQERRDQKRAALEAYLSQRVQSWLDTVGTTPPASVVEGWQREYMDRTQMEAEAERAERLARAEAEYERLLESG